MGEPLVWISGASSGIGQALAGTVPWAGARVIGIGRRKPDGLEHIEADLSDPSAWAAVGESFERELATFDGERAVFVHASGSAPVGFAGEVETGAYAAGVLLNSAAPQVLGHLFLAAARQAPNARRWLVMITSGAARSVYPGWASYGAAKAAVDQWVRDVGAEQERRGGVQVLSVAPGTVDTSMQATLREASEHDFPNRQKFVDLHAGGKLADPTDVARTMWSLLDRGMGNGSVVDLRELASASG